MPAPFHNDPHSLPPLPGAYVLLIELDRALELRLPGKPAAVLAPGRYLYCGSARGPGGLKARVGRHFRRDKTVRWHIDRLTTAGRMVGAWSFPGGDECALVADLAGLPVPVPGFGSSDCRDCASHLLSWPEGASPGILR
ncbi:GIY-YIG nuclease family protein [Azospirillum sp. sgz302134]